jgi:hypothetical protein
VVQRLLKDRYTTAIEDNFNTKKWEGPERAVLEAERKAARKFGVEADEIVVAAVSLWGHNLSTERDRRALQEVGPGDDARRVQAIRGHITRELLNEIESQLGKELGGWDQP